MLVRSITLFVLSATLLVPARGLAQTKLAMRRQQMTEKVVAQLHQAAKDENASGIWEAANTLRRTESEEQLAVALLRHTSHKNHECRKAAFGCLGLCGNQAKAITALLDELPTVEKDFLYDLHSALRKIGRPAVDPLLERIRTATGMTASRLATALLPISAGHYQVFTAQQVDRIAQLLKHPSAEVRRYMAFALAESPLTTERSIKALTSQLQDKNDRALIAACEAIAKAGPDAAGATPQLLKVARGKRASFEAIAALEGVEATEALASFLVSPDKDHRMVAAESLGRLGGKARPALARLKMALKDREPWVRLHISYAYWEITADEKPALKQMAESLAKHPQTTCDLICRMGAHAKSLVPVLIKYLETAPRDEAHHATSALGCIGDASKPAVPLMLKLIMTPKGDISMTMSEHLALLGRLAIAPTVAALHSENARMRDASAYILGNMGSLARDVHQPLALALRDENARVRAEVKSALRRSVEPLFDQSLEQMLTAIRRDPKIRKVVLALARHRNSKVDDATLEQYLANQASASIPQALILLLSRDGESRQEGASVLRRIGPRAKLTEPTLRRMQTDPDVLARISAASALWAIMGQDKTLQTQLRKAMSHRHPEVRRFAAIALADVGPAARSELASLRTLLESDPDASVRVEAAHSIHAIDPQSLPVEPVFAILEETAFPEGLLRLFETVPDSPKVRKMLLDLQYDSSGAIRVAAVRTRRAIERRRQATQ